MFTALTGGIGAGKSTALAIFKKLNLTIYDTDEMVHHLYESSTEFIHQVKSRWALSTTLSTKQLKKEVAKIVFSQPNELAWLESQIHPLITQQLLELKEKNESVIVAVPLLFELKMDTIFDLVITVSCPQETQLKRLQARGWSPEDIKGRLERQLTMNEKENLADIVISNCDSLEFLEKQCQCLVDRYFNI
jgi:dephospho-CoA kinase